MKFKRTYTETSLKWNNNKTLSLGKYIPKNKNSIKLNQPLKK